MYFFGWYMNPEIMLYVFLGTIAIALVMAFVQQGFKQKSLNFAKQEVSSQKTGYQVALDILNANNILNVQVVAGIEGKDHFNPRTNVISLSPSVYGSASLTAATIAAHEVGHAIQWNKKELKIKFRDALSAPVQAATKVGNAVMMIGFFMWMFTWGTSSLEVVSSWIVFSGLVIYGATGLFQLITLPVEFDASKKAIKQLATLNIINESEKGNAKSLLNSAAMTYVVAFMASALMFAFYLLLMLRSRR